jgi:hypothetical protein
MNILHKKVDSIVKMKYAGSGRCGGGYLSNFMKVR